MCRKDPSLGKADVVLPLDTPYTSYHPRDQSSRDHITGLVCTGAAALLFGVVAMLVKLAALPPLVMVECRGLVQWTASVVLCLARFASLRGEQPLSHVLCAPPSLRAWQLLRAVLYWAFQLFWWTALVWMPLGDATALVYCGPLFTGMFSHLMLKEPLTRTFFVCAGLDILGVVLIVQPEQLACLVRGGCAVSSRTGALQYYGGAALALSSAAVAGLLPVAVRKSKEVHWTTVEHVYAALPAAAGNPPAGAALLPHEPCCVRRRAAGRPA